MTHSVSLILGQVDYYEAFPKLVKLHTDMESMDIVQSGSVQSWYYFYDVWLQSSGKTALLSLNLKFVRN